MCQKACYVSLILFTINFIFLISAEDESSPSAENEQKYILPLLGYIHGYEIGENFALHLPPFILSPIVILPIMNKEQEIHLRQSAIEKKDLENKVNFQDIVPTEIISTDNSYTIDEVSEPPKFDHNTEIYNLNDNLLAEDDFDDFKQVNSHKSNSNVSQDNLENNGNLEITPTTEEANKENNEEKADTVTKPFGPYSNANYNNSLVDNQSITVPPFHNNLTLPNAENKWQNFSLPPQNSTENITKETNFSELNSTINNIIYFPTTPPTTDKNDMYPPRRYFQNIDSLSITTNSYTNVEHHLPPAYDDRWQRFSSLEKSYLTSGFRPLAGLYYDGFLHKTLNKQAGFQPNPNYNYYNYV